MNIDIYRTSLDPGEAGNAPVPYSIVETDVDLFWSIAHEMYFEIERANRDGRALSMICPVGPVFQYRRFVSLCRVRPLDLSCVHWFFMDEYLNDSKEWIDKSDPLSFRGFVDRELVAPLSGEFGFTENHVRFPDPANPSLFDDELEEFGGADLCIAGVGINGHLAFNEPPPLDAPMEANDFLELPSRVLRLTPETRTINSNTALRGAYELIPEYAVTVGFRQIMGAKRLRVYLNRPWQSAVVRKLLYGPRTSAFPASLIAGHPDCRLVLTETVAEKPGLGLR